MAERVPNLTDRLLLAYSSRQDFSRAATLTANIPGSYTRACVYLAIAEAQGILGMDSNQMYDQAIKAATTLRTHEQVIFQDNVPRSLARAGYILRALAFIDGKSVNNPFVYLDIARAQAKAGLDPRSAIFLAAQTPVYGRDLFYSLAKTAELQFELGMDPGDFLDQARKEVEGRGSKTIAVSFANCGRFDEAMEIVETIKVPEYPITERTAKNQIYADIARGLSERGRFAQALTAARLNGQPFLIAEILADSTPARVQKGEDPLPVVLSALKYTAMGATGDQYLHYEVDLYSRIAEAEARCGLDAQQTLSLALARLSRMDYPRQIVGGYIQVARAQAIAGQDITPTLTTALNHTDKILEGVREDDIHSDVEASILRYNLAELAAETGYYDKAREIADKFFEDDDELKAKIYILTAADEGRRGLTPEQLHQLTAEDRQAFLQSTNEVVRRAVIYFGLSG